MGWIKRNLLFAIGALIALVLLAAAAWYNFKSWNHNRASMEKLEKAYSDYNDAMNKKISPGNEQVDNIAAATNQTEQLREWIEQARSHFVPVPPIPNPTDGQVTTEEFAGSLNKTIQILQQAAANASVQLPPDYSFSFAAERNRVTFAPGSLNPLAAHLGEIKALCDVLFAAKINALDGIQREIISADDATGPQADYLGETNVTTPLAVFTPYAITFRCFSSDLAKVLSGLASSDHCFIVKAINVLPAGEAATATGGNPLPFAAQMPGSAPVAAPEAGVGAGGLQTVLDEQLLRVTVAIEVVKLSQK